jgi:hypothetical protein
MEAMVSGGDELLGAPESHSVLTETMARGGG